MTPGQAEIQSLVIPRSGWIRRFVDTYSGLFETPDEALAGVAYTVLSAAVGWRSYLQWPDYSEPLTLFTVLVGGSATAHKTSVLRIGERLAADANTEWRSYVGADETTPDLIRVVPGGHVSQAGLLDIVAPRDDDQAREWNDPLNSPPGILISWDEIADLVIDTGKQANFLRDTRQMLLRMYGGWQPGSKTRSGYVPGSRCAVSLIGTITTEDWVENLSKHTVTGGMMGRILAIPMGAPRNYVPLPQPVDPVQRRKLVDWIVALGATPYRTWGPVTLDPEAQSLWTDWYLAHKQRIASMEQEDPARASAEGAIFGRYQATALKFAGIQAISHWEPGTGPPTAMVNTSTLETVCRYIDIAIDQASGVATSAVETEDDRFTRRVTAALQKHGRLTISELQRKVRVRGINAERFHRLITLMHREGVIVLEQHEHTTLRGTRHVVTVELP